MKTPVMRSIEERDSAGFTLVEVMITLAILGILASISIPNFRSYQARAEYASMRAALKHLMDGEDLYFLDHRSFYPTSGNINIPSGTARDIPELAYSFPQGHKNRYRIRGTNNANRNRYIITVFCDFDSNKDGRNDRFTATTDIRRGVVRLNRVVVQSQ
jgi:prepilin-type N-terminal cleavage/methylation domain-containing protein